MGQADPSQSTPVCPKTVSLQVAWAHWVKPAYISWYLFHVQPLLDLIPETRTIGCVWWIIVHLPFWEKSQHLWPPHPTIRGHGQDGLSPGRSSTRYSTGTCCTLFSALASEGCKGWGWSKGILKAQRGGDTLHCGEGKWEDSCPLLVRWPSQLLFVQDPKSLHNCSEFNSCCGSQSSPGSGYK